MNELKIDKLDELTLNLNFSLAILSSVTRNCDDLEIYMLENFVEEIYKISTEIREIFNNSIL